MLSVLKSSMRGSFEGHAGARRLTSIRQPSEKTQASRTTPYGALVDSKGPGRKSFAQHAPLLTGSTCSRTCSAASWLSRNGTHWHTGGVVAEPSSWVELQNFLDDAVGEFTFGEAGVRHVAETSQPLISRSKASQARRARSTSLCET